VQSKYDTIFSQASGKANEILTAIQKGKPDLAPLVPEGKSDPAGPKTSAQPTVFIDKPKADPVVVPPASAIPSPFGEPTPAHSP
jgi:hypothetical protein